MTFSNISVGQAAFATVTFSAIGTLASAVAASSARSKMGVAAIGLVTLAFSAVSFASMTAYGNDSSTTPQAYFANVKKHTCVTFPAMLQVVAQSVANSVLNAFCDAIRSNVFRNMTR